MEAIRIPEKFVTVLQIIHPLIERGGGNAGGFSWAITGSLGMALQGMQLEIHDVDLQTDVAGAHAFQSLLNEYIITPLYLRESPVARSHFGVFEIAGEKVEVMGDYQNRLPDGSWSPVPELARLIRWARLDDMRLPVMDLEHECEAYRLLGREEKSQAIRRFIDGHGPG